MYVFPQKVLKVRTFLAALSRSRVRQAVPIIAESLQGGGYKCVTSHGRHVLLHDVT